MEQGRPPEYRHTGLRTSGEIDDNGAVREINTRDKYRVPGSNSYEKLAVEKGSGLLCKRSRARIAKI